jgi:hypothetical protein
VKLRKLSYACGWPEARIHTKNHRATITARFKRLDVRDADAITKSVGELDWASSA